jgi:hypothetical protein
VSTQATLDQIQQIYISYYGRPADAAGLTYWAAQLDANNGNLSGIIDAFANSAESTTLYGANSSPTDLITAIYENVLHRAPDADGLAFYVQGLKDGTFTAGSLALSVLNGAQNTDATLVQNELSAANQFTAAATSYSGDTATVIGRTFLSLVSADDSANSTLQTHFNDFVNAASTATTDPSHFAGDVSGGVLTDPTIIYPTTTGGDGSGSGDTGSGSGDSGSGSQGDGGNPSFAMSVDPDSHQIIFSNASGTITVTGITPGTSNTGDRTIQANDGGQPISYTVDGGSNNSLILEGFTVANGQTLKISDQLVNDWNVGGAGDVVVTLKGNGGTYDLTAINNTGNLTVVESNQVNPDELVVTLAQAQTAGLTSHYTLADNVADLNGSDDVITNADHYIIKDSASLVEVLLSSEIGFDLAKVSTVITTDDATIALSLDQVKALVAVDHITFTNGYALNLPSDADLGALTVAEETAVFGATGDNSYTYTLADSIANLTNHTTDTGVTGYTVVDTAANILDHISEAIVTSAAAVVLSADATESVANANALEGLSNFSLNDYTLTLADTIDNLRCNTTADGATAYIVVDTASNILAHAGGNIVTGAAAVELSADATDLTVAQEIQLNGLNNFSLNGNALTLADSIFNLVNHTTDANVSGYSVLDTASDIIDNASSSIVTGAAAVKLSANAIESVSDADALTGVQGFDLNNHTLTLADTIAHLNGHTADDGATAYDVVDTASNILTDISSGTIVNGAAAVELSADATVSVNDAQQLAGSNDFSVNDHVLTLKDNYDDLTASGASDVVAGGHIIVTDTVLTDTDIMNLNTDAFKVDMTAAQTLTGSVLNLSGLLNPVANQDTFSGHEAITLSDSGTIHAADLHTILAATDGSVTAASITELFGGLADVAYDFAASNNPFGPTGSVNVALTDTTLVNDSDMSTLQTVIGETTGLVDASDVTSALTLDLQSNSNEVNFTGGSEGNTIFVGTGEETLNIGFSVGGINTIDVSSVFGGNGNDDGSGNVQNALTITGFSMGFVPGAGDTLTFGDGNLAVSQATAPLTLIPNAGLVTETVTNGIVSFGGVDLSQANVADVLSSVETLVAPETAAAFVFNGNTYVVAANASNAHTVVELTGVTSESSLSVSAGHVTLSLLLP